MNAYFQIASAGNMCVIKLFPPTDGGAGINTEEILEYLSIKNISYDLKELAAAINNLSAPLVIKTTTEFRFAEGEYVKVNVSPDNMTATVRMIPPFLGGPQMTDKEFVRELTSRGINTGIDTEAISAFLQTREYCKDVVVAKGTPPVQGKDAEIEYFFNTDPRVRPTLKEDGSVDFFNLNTINHCKEGDLLAKLHPAVPGQIGMNIKGERIKPRDVRSAVLRFGRNIEQNESKTELRSLVSGHVNYVEGKVFVSNVLEVENVDNSVGNIVFDGSVRVNGNVCENFSVKANGNVEVRGVVEGAVVEAGGDIIVARGMNGMHKGMLKARGNVIVKFLENAKVEADGYVESDSILHSTVISGSDIRVTGKRGFITGGKVCASSSVTVKNLGSSMGADTVVEVGTDTAVKQEVIALQKEIAELNKTLAPIKQVLDGAKQKLAQGIKMPTAQLLQIQQLAVVNKDKSARLAECMANLETLQNLNDVEMQGQVIVTGDVYPGTKIVIGDVSMIVKSGMKYCRFIKEAGDVKMAAIY